MKQPRLQFTEKELTENSPVGKAARKAAKAAQKADQAQEKLPKRKKPKVALRFEDSDEQQPKGKKPASGKKLPKVKLSFEDEVKNPPKRGTPLPTKVPQNAVCDAIQSQTPEQEQDENVGVEAAQTAVDLGQRGTSQMREASRRVQLRPYRGAEKAERNLEKANLRYFRQKVRSEVPSSNSFSRWQQKQQIKQQYAAAVRQTSGSAVKGVSKATDKLRKLGQAVIRNSKVILVVLALLLMLSFFTNVLSSCSVMIEGIGSAITAGTYPVSDETLLGAENMYVAKETELDNYLASYESNHDYDEYHFNLDEIEHDPYVLASLLSARNPGDWSTGEITEMIEDVFRQQYVLTEHVQTEIRYKTEVKTGVHSVYDEATQSYVSESYTYTVEVPYSYTICTVTLENRHLDRLPVQLLNEQQLSMYATYMATLGNRPELWPESPYVELYIHKTGQEYDVPEIADEKAAAMIREAQKYLGYPYVWGGSSPSTSFDCSGFVCWAANHAGWNVGRTSAQGLCNLCTPIAAAIAQPGDLIFFKGTYDTPGVSHVGIYLGNNTMIHCGDPIKYANINTTYWQIHFYTFGRLP